MIKIAFISNWFDFNENNQNNFIERKKQYNDEKIVIKSLYKTAKKYFLPNYNVDHIFITNTEINIENVKNIKVDLKLENFWHVCLMKILSINYLKDYYDYYFINDPDQIFIDTIDDDILKNDFVILDHWSQTIDDVHKNITNKITLDFEESKKSDKWLLGNFFGGKSKYIKELCEQTQKLHEKYYENGKDFYTIYPEEIFLIKYLYENNVIFNRYNVSNNPNSFMFVLNDDYIKNLIINTNIKGSVKLIHDTKRYPEELKKIIENYE